MNSDLTVYHHNEKLKIKKCILLIERTYNMANYWINRSPNKTQIPKNKDFYNIQKILIQNS